MKNVECKLFLGPMFSGKTSEIIRVAESVAAARLRCLVIKYSGDNRYGKDDTLYAHDGVSLSSKDNIVVVQTDTLLEIEDLESYDIVVVDEGQFYGDLPEFVRKCISYRIDIYIAALDGDYLRRPFGRISEVIPLCTFITKLTGICGKCKRAPSAYTAKLTIGTEDSPSSNPSEDPRDVGGREKYMATCVKCFSPKT